MRGAIAFILALQVPTLHKNEILATTLVIIFFTVLAMGGVTIPFLHRLKIATGVVDKSESETISMTSEEGKNFFFRVDRQYLIPFFTKKKANQVKDLKIESAVIEIGVHNCGGRRI